jgi:hypothetical protein
MRKGVIGIGADAMTIMRTTATMKGTMEEKGTAETTMGEGGIMVGIKSLL